jgi:hypothetical protein
MEYEPSMAADYSKAEDVGTGANQSTPNGPFGYCADKSRVLSMIDGEVNVLCGDVPDDVVVGFG